MMLVMMLPQIWLWAVAVATSISPGPGVPRRLSPVLRLNEHGSFDDTLTIDFSIPGDPHLSNMDRRWYVQNDPNARFALGQLGLPRHRDSAALYSYLTRNSSAEVPGDLQFKVALYPQPQTELVVNGEPESDFNVVKGKAYRYVNNPDSPHWRPVGWARFVVHNSTEGMVYKGSFQVDDELGLGFPSCVYHFTQLSNLPQVPRHDLDSEYVVWRDFDARESTKRTSLGALQEFGPHNFTFLESLGNGGLFKRDDTNDTTNGASSGVDLYTTVGNTTGCPSRRQVALVGLLADCNYLKEFSSLQGVRQHLIDMVSQASRLYEDAFNITLGLSELVIADNSSCPTTASSDQPWNYACQSDDSNSINNRLGNLTDWRIARSNDSLATWSLMTSCSAGSVVGLSWLGAVCQATSQGAVGANVVSYTSLDYLVLAHEIGHSFGAVHDCTSDTCSEGLDKTSQCCPRTSSQCVGSDGEVFVMNPASSEGISGFSACSQGNICSGILNHNVNTTCLQANTGGLSLYTNNTCGNGIVEAGEDCDCGGVDGCGENSCCDPTTCKFKNNAVCDDSNEECCSGCQFASSSVVCRAATGPCDYAEYCPGNSTTCPSDQYVGDGTSCQLNSSSTGLVCMSGHCSSRDLQCQNVMGSSIGGTVKACSDDSSCTLTCQSSNYGSNTCISTNQNFLDGTPCKVTGKCSNGVCQGGSSSSSSGSGSDSGFFGSNGGFGSNWKWIIIGVAIFVVACIVVAIVWRSCAPQSKQGYPPQTYESDAPSRSYARPFGGAAPAPAPAPAYNDPNFSYMYAAPNYPPPPQPAYMPPNYSQQSSYR